MASNLTLPVFPRGGLLPYFVGITNTTGAAIVIADWTCTCKMKPITALKIPAASVPVATGTVAITPSASPAGFEIDFSAVWDNLPDGDYGWDGWLTHADFQPIYITPTFIRCQGTITPPPTGP